jgi:hypothetical protein
MGIWGPRRFWWLINLGSILLMWLDRESDHCHGHRWPHCPTHHEAYAVWRARRQTPNECLSMPAYSSRCWLVPRCGEDKVYEAALWYSRTMAGCMARVHEVRWFSPHNAIRGRTKCSSGSMLQYWMRFDSSGHSSSEHVMIRAVHAVHMIHIVAITMSQLGARTSQTPGRQHARP